MKRLLLFALSLALTVTGCSEKPYVIVQIADAQLGFTAADRSNTTGEEYVNDLTYEVDCLIKAVEMINGLGPDAVVLTGDQVNFVDNEEQWEVLGDILAGIDPSVKVLHIPGNHDVIISGNHVDSSPFCSRYGEDRFVQYEKGVRLVGINTNLIRYDDPSEEDQFSWLENVLKKEKSSDVTLIFGHHPFFTEDIDEEDGYFQVAKVKRRRYFDMFKGMDVDAVYAGHLHDSAEGVYEGIPMKTTTSVGFQIGDSRPSVRVITVAAGTVSDTLQTL